VDWQYLVGEYLRNYPDEAEFNWEKIEQKLNRYFENYGAISKSQTLLLAEILRVKKDYYDYLQNKPQQGKEINAEPKKIVKSTKTNTKKLSKQQIEIVKSIAKEYKSITLILQNQEFMRLIDLTDLQRIARILLNQTLNEKVNWKRVDNLLLNFMKNKAINISNSMSKDTTLVLQQFEDIEKNYQHYSIHSNIKEDLKNLDILLPKEVTTKTAINQELSYNTKIQIPKNKVTTKKGNFCNSECVKICQSNFNKYKPFLSCSKSACLCSEFDLISKTQIKIDLEIKIGDNAFNNKFVFFVLFSIVGFVSLHIIYNLIKNKSRIANPEEGIKHYELISADESFYLN
jgi:hypothetical protein